jgi:hypothetical protein
MSGELKVTREHLKLGLRAESTMPYNPNAPLGGRIGWVIGAQNRLIAAGERRGKPIPNKPSGRKEVIQ